MTVMRRISAVSLLIHSHSSPIDEVSVAIVAAVRYQVSGVPINVPLDERTCLIPGWFH